MTSRGKKHKIGDKLDQNELAVLGRALLETKPGFWRRRTIKKLLKRQEWSALLANLTAEQIETVRLAIVDIATNDPTLSKVACGVGNAFTAATKIRWKTGKEIRVWRENYPLLEGDTK